MKIIICDDEMHIRDDLKQRLKDYYSSLDVLILSVSSGEELLKMADREPEGIFCVFLDIEMQGMDWKRPVSCGKSIPEFRFSC